MSAGYLGKISALVTVNTTDIASKVQSGFAAPFDKALRSIENSLRSTNKSVERSFEDMYTTSQKRLRAMAAAQMGAVKNFNSDDFSKRFTVSDSIAGRIGKLAQEIEKTSGAVRSRFEPAIVSAQAEAQELIDRLAQKLPVATDEIEKMAAKVDALTESFVGATTASERMAAGWAAMDKIGRKATDKANDKQRIAGMFAAAGAQNEEAKRIAAEAAKAKAMVGASSPISLQTPWRRGLIGPAGPVTTGVGASTSIAGMGFRSVLPPDYLSRQVAQKNAERQSVLDESAARARDAAQRSRQEDMNRQREAAARFSAQAATSRRSESEDFAGSLGGRGAAGIRLGLDRNALAASTAELQIIQRAIGKASAEARGPAVEAFVRLKNAIADAFENGTIDSEATRRNIARLRAEAVNSASQVSGVNKRGLAGDVKRAGDVARGGADKLGLAVQQAGYAIDDFFSATGGMDQKIRAVSNNISQLGFIVGGTAGLFAGMAVTIGSQAVVALMKWADAGRTSADRTEALNSALAKQKSLAEDLAAAYRDLAKSLTGAMSPQGAKAADRARQLSDLGSKRRQSMEESVYAGDSGVAAARASVVVEEKNALKATTATQQQVAQFRVDIAKRLVEAAKREAVAKAVGFNQRFDRDVAANPAAQQGAGVQDAIQRAISTFGQIQMSGMRAADARKFDQVVQAQMAAVPMASDKAGAAAQLRQFLDDEFKKNENARAPGTVAAPVVADLLEQLAILEFGLKEANAAIVDDVTRSLVNTSDALEGAKKSLDSAAMETQGVTALRTEIDRVAASLEALSLAASETTDKGVLAAIAEDAAAANALGDRLNDAARKSKEFADKLQEAITEENNAAARGVELGKIRDQGAQADDIRAAAANIGNDAERNAFVARAFGNVVADTQTILKGFGQERENAILGGPSRAALNASDVSTMEGQRELNRLLRGDDPNRDVNFAEMKHQSDLLQTIADRILAATGIAVEFR